MDAQRTRDLQAGYDRVAVDYVEHVYDELRHKPFDRAQLDRFAERVRELGPACDMGCGPGQIARYLYEHGVEACGVDLSAGMIEQARQLNPGLEFNQGDMLQLDIADETWGGIAAFYSIIHVPRAEVVQALRELKRTLKPNGLLLLAFHLGDGVQHNDEWWGHAVSIDFIFFRSEEMEGYLRAAGFVVEETIERGPYPKAEYQSRRAYIWSRKPPVRSTHAAHGNI
jgi:SAM-dependent methyltransferase